MLSQAYDGLLQGLEQIPVGMSKHSFETFEKTRQDLFAKMMQMMSMKIGGSK
jgi:hypothetical protein